MPAIRARCHTCGVVEMELSAMSLNIEAGAYSFHCPACGVEITRRASRTTLMLLMAAGVRASAADLSVEIDPSSPNAELPLEDWSPDPTAPAFTSNDLIDFHFRLLQDAELTELPLKER